MRLLDYVKRQRAPLSGEERNGAKTGAPVLAAAQAPPQAKIFYGWWIVLAGLITSAYGSGVFQYGFSVFFKPLTTEFGWSRALTAGAFSLSSLEGGLEGPIIGPLIDRFGPRKMMLVGVALLGAGLVLMGRVNSLLGFYLVYLLLMATGHNTGFMHSAMAAVAYWFRRRSSIAMGLIVSASGFGGAIMTPLVGWMVVNYGWRNTALVLGIGTFLFCTPFCFVMRHRPEQYGLLPDGDLPVSKTDNGGGLGAHSQANAAALEDEVAFTVWQALKSKVFWFMTVIFMLRYVAIGAIIVHQIPFLIDRGFEPQTAANALGLLAFMGIIGKIGFGYLGDMLPKRYLLSFTYILQAVGLIILISANSIQQVYLFTFVFGIGWGAAPLMQALRAEYFGRKYFASIAGFQQALTVFSNAGGPIFAGWMFDATGSYNVAFTFFVLTYVVGALLYFFLKPPKAPEPRPVSIAIA